MSEDLDYIQPGDRAGPYRIVRRFKGRGGMARVFEGEVREKYRRTDLPRRLALKIAKEDYQGALVAEADFLSRFDHPNVVRIFPLPRGDHPRPVYAARERFRFGWGWYYAMELLDGGSLERRLTRTTTDLLRLPSVGERRLGLLEALGVARQLTRALEHIHERYVLNLDVKPGNVLFRRRRFRYLRGSVPQVVLCDFGIARDLRYPRAGLLGVATPEYVSPEQAMELDRRHRRLDARSDIFSLGIVLYEMLTGALPFENIVLVAEPGCAPLPPRQLRSSIPPALEDIVMRALAKHPDYRFQTAANMRVALEQVPTPLDWGAAARRTFAGIALAACLTGAGGACRRCVVPPPPPPSPSPTPSPVVEVTTRTPAVTPVTPTSDVSPTVTLKPTCTPASTSTPTIRPRPTYTPSPGG
jgi:serine/threonine protein kinase